MKNTWYLGFFVFALALIGVSLDKSASANQEIILKFTELGVTEGEAQEVLSFVKDQLKELAVGDIQIRQSKDGALKISYYSKTSIAEIKNILSSKSNLVIDNEDTSSQDKDSVPKEKDLAAYQLDIIEIGDANDLLGAKGTVVEFKTENVRFFTPDVSIFSEQILKEKDASVALAYHTFNAIALAVDDNFCTVPQVRAGPAVG